MERSKVERSGRERSEVERLSPTEKYDAAIGDYYLTASRYESSTRGRGLLDTFPNTPFWAGYCNSISLAAMYQKEPKHRVTVLNPDGYEIQFYPKDIKALLGISYLFTYPKVWDLGNRCELNTPKSQFCLDVNPAALVIALTNLIGLAKVSFIIDKEPFLGIQNAPIRKAEVKVINPPYFTSERQHFFKVEDLTVKWLVDVEINLTLSRMTPLDPSHEEEDVSYRATLGLDKGMRLVGGRWADPFHHPDFAWGGNSNLTVPGKVDDQLMGNRWMEWPVIQELVAQSSGPRPPTGPISLTQIIKTPISHGFAFDSEADGIAGGISYLKFSNPAEVYGRLEGQSLGNFKSVELVILGNESQNKQDLKLATEPLKALPGVTRVFFRLKTSQSLEGLENLMLRLNKTEKKGGSEFIQFQMPLKKKFESILDREG